MTYTIERLAPGSYDILLHGEAIAALIRFGDGTDRASRWTAELLLELPRDERPAPFIEIEHQFDTFADACDWLGVSVHPAN